MEKKIAVFAGTFDPITVGHEEVIKKASELFDSLTVAICINKDKTTLFNIEARLQMVRAVCSKYPNCQVVYHDGMVVDLMKKIGAKYSVRGVRNNTDFKYESQMTFFNKKLYPDMITIYLPCDEKFLSVSSTKVRNSIKEDGNLKGYVSSGVLKIIKNYLNK